MCVRFRAQARTGQREVSSLQGRARHHHQLHGVHEGRLRREARRKREVHLQQDRRMTL